MSEKITIRNLQTKDIFIMSKILKKMNLNIRFDDKMSAKEIGISFLKEIFENIHLAEDEWNEFLASLAGVSVEEFKELGIETTLDIINQLKEQKSLAAFLKLAGK